MKVTCFDLILNFIINYLAAFAMPWICWRIWCIVNVFFVVVFFPSKVWRSVLTSGNVLAIAGSPVNGDASSPPPAINDNRHTGDNLDTILLQLRQVTRERDELRKRLALASPGTTFDDCRCKYRPVCWDVFIAAIFSPEINNIRLIIHSPPSTVCAVIITPS